jgi:hypothetical protein
VLNKYKIGLWFLKSCTNYFSRRACLHYIGNTLGAKLGAAIQAIDPWKLGKAVVLGFSINYASTVYETREEFKYWGEKAAEAAKNQYLNLCNERDLKPDSYTLEVEQKLAYEEAIIKKRNGSLYLYLNIVGWKMDSILDEVQFNEAYEQSRFEKKFQLEPTTGTLEELRQLQIKAAMEMETQLKNIAAKNDSDFKILATRSLQSIASSSGQNIDTNALETLLTTVTSDEIIKFIMSERLKLDEHVFETISKTYSQHNAGANVNSIQDEINKAIEISRKEFNIKDYNMIDSTTDKPLEQEDVKLNQKLPDSFEKPSPIRNIFQSEPDSDQKLKRTIDESSSSDSGDAKTMEPTCKKSSKKC